MTTDMTTQTRALLGHAVHFRTLLDRRGRSRRVVVGTLGYALAGSLFIGCVGTDRTSAPAPRAADVTLGTIAVSPMNVILAVGDTVQLHVAATTLTGTPLANVDSIEYLLERPGDSTRVFLSPSGMVTGRLASSPGSPVLVQVLAFKDDLVRADESDIQVVAAAFPGAMLSIHPVPPDSAKLAMYSGKTIVPVISNPTTGQKVLGPTVRYEFGPGDSTLMQCYVPFFNATTTLSTSQLRLSACTPGSLGTGMSLNGIMALGNGSAWIHARMTVFGVPLHDSVQYTLTYPYSGNVSLGPSVYSAGGGPFGGAGEVVHIAPGGTVRFLGANSGFPTYAVSVAFDNPAAATAAVPASVFGDSVGNITTLQAITGGSTPSSSRRFLTAGTYHWTATVSDGPSPYKGQQFSGTIIVQ